QNAVAEPAPVRERHRLRRRIDLDHLLAEEQFNLPLGPEGERADEQALELLLAGQIVLGQRRALIRRMRLGADDGERAGEAELAERDRSLGAAMAAADNEDVAGVHAAVLRRGR